MEILFHTTVLEPTDIEGMFAAGVPTLPAPPDGMVNHVIARHVRRDSTGTPFTGGGPIRFETQSLIQGNTLPKTVLTEVGSAVDWSAGAPNGWNEEFQGSISGEFIGNTGAAFADGTGTLTVDYVYVQF